VRELEEWFEDILGIWDLALNFESGFVVCLVAVGGGCGGVYGGQGGDGDVFWEEGTRGGGHVVYKRPSDQGVIRLTWGHLTPPHPTVVRITSK
jgi:hypothetical protein